MAEASTRPAEPAGDGPRITDEGIERLRQRVGIPVARRGGPAASDEIASVESIRKFAHAYGDVNPLFTDPAYAAGTPWGTVIGPPGFMVAEPVPVEHTPEQRALMKGDPFAGISDYMSGEEWESWAPVRPGDRLRNVNTLVGVEDKHSDFAGRTALSWHGNLYVNQAGEAVRFGKHLMVYAERKATSEKGKYKSITRTVYDDAMLAEIDDVYRREEIRGAHPRLWDSVQAGDAVPRIVRGPLLRVDIMAWHMGTGSEGRFLGVVASRRAFLNRQRIPKFYTKNEFGAWDSAQRCHWEDSWAQQIGQPAAYDYGAIRDNWVMNAITNWMGDAAWLWKYRSSIRRFNYVGDTTWISGSVVDKYRTEDGCAIAALELQGLNQRGEATITVHAEVALPESESGLAKRPKAPEVAGEDAAEMVRPFLH